MGNSRRKILLVSVSLALAATAAALCIGVSSWRDRRWDTLELSFSDNPTTFDPALIKDVAGGRLAALVYPNLVKYDESGALVGDAALSWTVSNDARVYIFRLREGARFSDGSPLESFDVAASFERALCPEVASPRAWVLDRIKGAAEFHEGKAASISGLETPDAQTLVVTLERPSGTLLPLLTMPAAAILPRSTPRKPFWGVDTLPVAGGPFKVARFEGDVALTLEANPNYYGGAPLLRAIRFRIVKNPFAMVTEFRQGRLDIIDVPDSFDSFFMSSGRWRETLESVAGQNTYYLGFNCTRSPFDDRDFRRALSMTIDRQAVIDSVLRGRAAPATGPIPPGLSGYDAEFEGLGFDRERARSMVAGKSPERTLGLLVVANADSIVVAQSLCGQLAEIGIDAEVTPRERGTFKTLLANGDFDMVYYSWVADYSDGENFLVPLFKTARERSGGNYTAYSSQEVDAILEDAASTAGDEERCELYREAAAIVVADAPRVFLWHSTRVTARQPWVKGFRLLSIYNAERFEEVSIERVAAAR